MTQALIERRGGGFVLAKLLDARRRTWDAVGRIAESIRPGMSEEEAYEASRGILRDMGSEKSWHRSWIRFGPNTLKMYGVLSPAGTRLGPNDVFFIDIGPVWDGYEGDAGDTFVVGADAEMRRCRDDARRIFEDVKARWSGGDASGRELYAHAARRSEELGWRLNMDVGGHRLSEFPHAVHYKGSMADVDFAPSPEAWILEIQIRHPSKEFGAFYEDLLV